MDRIRYLSSWSQITLLVTDEQGNAKAYTLWNGRQEPAPRFYLYAASKYQTLCPGAKQVQTTHIIPRIEFFTFRTLLACIKASEHAHNCNFANNKTNN